MITYVGVGAASTGDYGSRSPAVHASTAVGDTKVLYATVRNTAAVPVAPAGWTVLIQDTNMLLAAKLHESADAAPTVTFTGGAAGDDTLAQVATWRGLYILANAGPTAQSNASTQHINLPAHTPTRASSLMLIMGWKQTGWTSVTALAGADAEIDEPQSTVGNDAGMVWAYDIQTTIAAAPAGPFNVNGGVAAISKSWIISLNQAPTITVTNYTTVYPPRNLITVGSVVVGDLVSIYRVVAGVRTLIQAGSGTATDVNFLRVDATLPFGVAVSYVAVVGGMEVASSAVTYTLPGGKVVVSDAIGDLAAEVVIWAWPDKTRERSATVFKPGGRNVVVSGDFAQSESDVELYTDAWSSAENLVSTLVNATQGIVQIRQPGGYDGVDGFYAVTAYRERRFSQDGSDDKRTHVLHLVEVDGWASALQALGFTYADLTAAYAGLTYAALSADYATYLLLDQADLS